MSLDASASSYVKKLLSTLAEANAEDNAQRDESERQKWIYSETLSPSRVIFDGPGTLHPYSLLIQNYRSTLLAIAVGA